MRPLIPLLVLALAIALPGAAHAGGWATVEAGGVPDGVSAGQTFQMELLVKQHGITPLDDLSPKVEITSADGDVRTFTATPAGEPGTYAAAVTYPTAGTWSTRLYDGFTDATPHRMAPLEVAAAAGGASAGTDLPSPQVVAIGVLVLLFAGAWFLLGRRGRYLPAP
jgi:hypothetical protein